MNAPGQADPDRMGLLRSQAMQAQGCEQAEHRAGNLLGNDLKVDVLANRRCRQAIEPALQAYQQTLLTKSGEG